MLQNEAADANEDLEHFEDIPDNDGNQAGNDSNKDHAADTSSESGNDTDKSNSTSSDSEEDSFRESDDLFGADGLDKLEESKPTSDQEMHNIQGRTRPGGYDPRYREPRYWYKRWFLYF